MSNTNPLTPQRGEIWDVNFDPTVGSEIQKIRPAVVISSDSVGILPIKLVAPITGWQDYFEENIWHVQVEHNNTNGLKKDSAVDVMQIRSVDVKRFIRRRGRLDAILMEEIIAAVTAVIGNE